MKFTKAKNSLSKAGHKVLKTIKNNGVVFSVVGILFIIAISTTLFGMNNGNIVAGETKVEEITTTSTMITTSTTTDILTTTSEETTITSTTSIVTSEDDVSTTLNTTIVETTQPSESDKEYNDDICESEESEEEVIVTTTVNTTTVINTEPVVETTTIVTEPIREYIVYKPGTHYVHKSSCRWFDSTCFEITTTEGYEARKCSECNPDIEIINTYTPPVVETTGNLPITEYERILLCNVVGREYGSNWVPTAEKAKVVAVVMNRVRDSRFPNDIYSVLTQPYQFSGYVAYSSYTRQVTDDVIAAVQYYFDHQSEFSSSILYFEGDGTWNYFH